MPRAAFLELGLAAVLISIFGGCSRGAAPVSQSTTEPSSPNVPDASNPMTEASAPSAQPHADHADGGRPTIVYVCPMHPEVTSTQPGQLCPKCNMKLVPKK